MEAVSICRDVLEVDSENREARITMILALTDQMAAEPSAFHEAIAAASDLPSEYDQAYYSGIAWERRAKSRFQQNSPGTSEFVYECVQEAMRRYEKAEALAAEGDVDPILRWNTCARFLDSHPHLGPASHERAPAVTLE